MADERGSFQGAPQGGDQYGVNLDALTNAVRGTQAWVILAAVVIVASLVYSVRIGRVTGGQVGILLNRISGKMQVIDRSGVTVYNGVTKDFYVLDKTMQTMEMTQVTSRGDREGKDDLKIKTNDGSDVYVDLLVQYRIDYTEADKVIISSGPGDAFKQKWARDYVRSACRNYLGELTTEEFYDSVKRNVKVMLAKNAVQKKVKPFGDLIDSIVIPTKPHFYEEYEQMIKTKKLADQAVLEERAKALAAKQKQRTMIVEEQNKLNVVVEGYTGLMMQNIIQAEAEGERARKAADAYFDRVTIGAGAELYQREKEAEGILAKKKAEAKGIEAMNKALAGEGGRNMVKLEYARKLKDVLISGKPITIRGDVDRFEHSETEPASSVRRPQSR